MATSRALQLSPSVVLSAAEDGYVAYDVQHDRLYRLNPTAALIVELCDGTRDLEHLRTDLGPLMGDDGRRWLGWIDTAIQDGLVSDAPTGRTPAAPPDATALSTRADSLQRRDRVLAAFLCQQRAAELAPDDPDVWLRLGELAHIVGRRDEARIAYQHYLSHHPDDAEIAHLLTALRDAAPPPRVSDRCIEQLYSRFADFYDENMTGELDYCAPDRLHDAVNAALAARGESPTAFDERCIPPGGVASRSNTAGMLPRRALPARYAPPARNHGQKTVLRPSSAHGRFLRRRAHRPSRCDAGLSPRAART